MHKTRLPAPITALVLCAALAASAVGAPAELQLRWSDLAQKIVGREIVDLPNGTHVDGRVLSVSAEALNLSNQADNVSIPRADVQVIHLQKKTKNTRLIGVGVGVGVAGGTAAAGYSKNGYTGAAVFLIGGAIGRPPLGSRPDMISIFK